MTLQSLRERFSGVGKSPADEMERAKSCSETLPYRALVRIEECGERLVELPRDKFRRFEPHPYQAAGASYDGASPFAAREGVAVRLEAAQQLLRERKPGWSLRVFDAFRPNTVQNYMVELSKQQVAKERGVDLEAASEEECASILSAVHSVWAVPSEDPNLPTPHSTGAAIDLTLEDERGDLVPMGGEIDEISSVSLPNYYIDSAAENAVLYHSNRCLLNSVMSEAGFCRLPHEWWHFSYGDQMWALIKSLEGSVDVPAIYGRSAGEILDD